MAHPLYGAYRKIDHARDHLKRLDREVKTFTETNPYRFVTKYDDEGVAHIVFEGGGQVPVVMSLIVGDVVHNLRSALDHVVYQLALLGGGSGETNAFPLFWEPGKYRDHQKRLLRDVPDPYRARIEALQPYHIVCGISPKSIPQEFWTHFWLMGLARLDNLDKHRLLLAAQAVIPMTQSPSFKGVRFAKGKWSGEGSRIVVEDGAELFTIEEIEVAGDPSEVKMDPNPSYTIVFGDPIYTPEEYWERTDKVAASVGDLKVGVKYIESVVRSFANAF
jgi:hypothetical protein